METHIYDEKNGLSYTLHGDYYLPDLVLNEEEPIYGKYGMLRKQFLKEHRLAKYQYLLLTGKLTEHLNQIDQESREQVEMLMEQMAEKQVRQNVSPERANQEYVGQQPIVIQNTNVALSVRMIVTAAVDG